MSHPAFCNMVIALIKHENLDQQFFLASFGFYLELSFSLYDFQVLFKVNYSTFCTSSPCPKLLHNDHAMFIVQYSIFLQK